jgi:23S rRNA-/tRNA-specific pseudouridylate synthase
LNFNHLQVYSNNNLNNFLSKINKIKKKGYQHQIRAHLAYGLGCPILGDHKYSHNIKLAPQKLPDEMLRNLCINQSKVRYVPMHLHSYRIILPEFSKNSNIFITAKLPLHFLNNLKRLKLRF